MKLIAEELKEINDLFGFTITGIENHLENDVPDPQMIINALTKIFYQYDGLCDKLNEEQQKNE